MTQIGWNLVTFALAIKQGSSGSFTVTSVVTDADGDALPSYDGWTAAVAFDSPSSGREVISLTPTVVGDAGAKTLTVEVDFTPSLTQSLPPGTYAGDVFLTEPDAPNGRYCPAQFQLQIMGSAA